MLKEFERDLKETAAKAKEVWSGLYVGVAGVRCTNITGVSVRVFRNEGEELRTEESRR